mmetsp:Transcript_22349/g.56088  ORF Transcript_22349/g.56088 Transcript_22349/m.56088 type:complete len:248 (-) Transcript_22349:390-1133(-)
MMSSCISTSFSASAMPLVSGMGFPSVSDMLAVRTFQMLHVMSPSTVADSPTFPEPCDAIQAISFIAPTVFFAYGPSKNWDAYSWKGVLLGDDAVVSGWEGAGLHVVSPAMAGWPVFVPLRASFSGLWGASTCASAVVGCGASWCSARGSAGALISDATIEHASDGGGGKGASAGSSDVWKKVARMNASQSLACLFMMADSRLLRLLESRTAACKVRMEIKPIFSRLWWACVIRRGRIRSCFAVLRRV